MGKALREEKGEDLRGEKALGGKGGNREWRENILGRKKEENGYESFHSLFYFFNYFVNIKL